MKTILLFLSCVLTLAQWECYKSDVIVGEENCNDDGACYPDDPKFNVELKISNLGSPGWRSSKEILCSGLEFWKQRTASIWSDSQGVFLNLYGSEPEDQFFTRPRVGVYFNDGSGWQEIYSEVSHFADQIDLGLMKGVPNKGLLFLYNIMAGPRRQCGLYLLEEGELSCEWDYPNVSDLFVVNEQLAYATQPERGLIRFNGVDWQPFAELPPTAVYSLWANEDVVFALGLDGEMLSLSNEEWTEHEISTFERFSSVWGFAIDDVWAATESLGVSQIYHFDGKAWEVFLSKWPFPHDQCNDGGTGAPMAVRGMWGSKGVLYAWTDFQILRLEDGEFELVLDIPCQTVKEASAPYYNPYSMPVVQILSLWGNDKDEVFALLDYGPYNEHECGAPRVMVYDGSMWHWF